MHKRITEQRKQITGLLECLSMMKPKAAKYQQIVRDTRFRTMSRENALLRGENVRLIAKLEKAGIA